MRQEEHDLLIGTWEITMAEMSGDQRLAGTWTGRFVLEQDGDVKFLELPPPIPRSSADNDGDASGGGIQDGFAVGHRDLTGDKYWVSASSSSSEASDEEEEDEEYLQCDRVPFHQLFYTVETWYS